MSTLPMPVLGEELWRVPVVRGAPKATGAACHRQGRDGGRSPISARPVRATDSERFVSIDQNQAIAERPAILGVGWALPEEMEPGDAGGRSSEGRSAGRAGRGGTVVRERWVASPVVVPCLSSQAVRRIVADHPCARRFAEVSEEDG